MKSNAAAWAGDIDTPVLDARFVRAYPPAQPAPGMPTVSLPFLKGDLVTRDDFALLSSPPLEMDDLAQESLLYIGDLDGAACLAYPIADDAALPEGLRATGLRSLYGQIEDDAYAVAGYAIQLLNWRKNYRFCSRCGAQAQPLSGGWAMECPVCGFNAYPPVSPAMLVLVHDGGNRVLLAKKPGWGTRYSILAGFVEPGESLEGCVMRESLEEVGVHVRDLVYCGSQPWPFPHQIMIGFTARHAQGDIRIDATELEEARWFERDALPDLPGKLSLSRQIIDAWIADGTGDA